jgi:hypothetical protein
LAFKGVYDFWRYRGILGRVTDNTSRDTIPNTLIHMINNNWP